MVRSLRGAAANLWQDTRYGARLLAKQPGFTLVAVLTLALGVGANTTIFTWIRATLLTPIPGVADTGDLVAFAKAGTGEVTPPSSSYLDLLDLRDQARGFTGLAGYHDDWVTLTGDGMAERAYATLATTDYFDVLGVKPILGRTFVPEEDLQPGGSPVVVISYGLWTSRYEGSARVLGRTLEINHHPYAIVGVTPRGFQGAKTGLRTDLWVPVVMAEAVWGFEPLAQRDNTWLNVLGRLAPGVGRTEAQAEVDAVMEDLTRRYPEAHRDGNMRVLYPLWSSPVGANASLHLFLPMLLAIAGVVLLLTCINVANLVLVRSVDREQEIAIRRSFGAGGAHLLRQLIVEGLLLGILGATAALVLTTWTVGGLTYFLPPLSLPLALPSRVDGSVLVVAFALALSTGLAVSLLPAVRAARIGTALAVRGGGPGQTGGRRRSRVGRTLVASQVALAMLLLTCAGLFIRSSRLAEREDPGFDRDGVLLATFDLLPTGCSTSEGVEFDRLLLARVEALPGIEAATLADWVPLTFQGHSSIVEPEGYAPRPHEAMEVGRTYAGPGYLRAMRIGLVEGRDLEPSDDADAEPVAVVNEAFAERYWPGQGAVGRRVRVDRRWYTVVGVARQATYQDPREGRVPFLYLPILQAYYPQATLHVRVAGDPLAYAPVVAEAVHALNAELPLFDVTTLKEATRAAGFRERIAASVVTLFGALALLLATVGIYGVVASATRQRTREVGVRVALGGTPGEVVRLVLAQGIRVGAVGLLAGLALSLSLTPLLRSQLFATSPADPVTYLAVVLVLSAVVALACYAPARRAARVDPVRALRAD